MLDVYLSFLCHLEAAGEVDEGIRYIKRQFTLTSSSLGSRFWNYLNFNTFSPHFFGEIKTFASLSWGWMRQEKKNYFLKYASVRYNTVSLNENHTKKTETAENYFIMKF